MNPIYEVTHEDIEKLKDISLSTLMFKLMYLEAAANNIEKSSVSGSLSITIGDGGQDGGVTWEGSVEKTDWFPSRKCLFQNKAKSFGPQECYNELFQDMKNNILKPRLEDIGNNGKHYIIFNNKSLTEEMIDDRINRIISGFHEAGRMGVTKNNITFYGSAQIAAWTNQYYAAIVYVKETQGQNIGSNFQLWDRWSGYADYKLTYVEDVERSSHLEFIKKKLLEPQSVIRLIGLSGLGKSRLVLETFRPPEKDSSNIKQSILNNMVVYIDCQDVQNSVIISDICQLINHGRSGIVVFDNCRPNLHDKLVQEITHKDSKLSMISIDNDPSERNDNVILLKKLPDQVIEQIVVTAFPNLTNNQTVIRKIVELSGGFPKIASLLANSYLENEPNVGSITQKSLVERMIGCSLDITKDECKTLCSLSVFDHIGFLKELEGQLKYVADEIADVDVSTVNSYVHRFKDREIIDFRHKFLQVVPKPLAIRLAEEWWKVCLQSKAETLFTDENLPPDMLQSLCKQFRHLDYVPQARDIARKLCEEQAPFGQAEALYSERGSMVFRYLVEVNPQTTADAIHRVISRTQLADLKLIKGRRSLVIALEMLCFWRDQFSKASRSLMRLALSESEPYANNATGQFLQLFQIHLSGANATFIERLKLIKELLSENNNESINLAVKALKNVVFYGDFTRSCGSELQGTKPELTEWMPEKWNEVFDYIRTGLDMLLSVLDHSPTMEGMVKEAFERALYGLLRLGLLGEIVHFIECVQTKLNIAWSSLLQEFIRYQKQDLFIKDPIRSKCIAECIDVLSPHTIEDQIQEIICRPPYDNEKEENGRYIDLSEQKAVELVAELIQNKRIYEHLELMLIGEQRYGTKVGFLFGEQNEDKLALFNDFVKEFKEIDPKESNPSVIAGLLQYIKQTETNLYREIIQSLLRDDFMNRFLFDVIRMQDLDAYDLIVIEQLVESKLVNPNQFRILSYGSVLDRCSPEHVQRLVWSVVEINTDFVHPSIDILAMYLMFDEGNNKLHSISPFIQELLIKAPLSSYVNNDSMSLYHRHELVKKTLKLKEIDPKFLSFIITDILLLSRDYWSSHRFHSEIRSLVFLLLESRFEESWDIISDFLLKDTENSYGLLYLLNPKNEIGEKKGIDSILSESVLIDWCKKETRAYETLPSLIPVLTFNGADIQFHKLILLLFDLKLYNQITLDRIYSNMMPRAWGGSAIPIYEGHIIVLKSLDQYDDPLIVDWVATCLDNLKKRIEFEKDRESEDYFRFN
ncbi:MAG TPA: hypothetical protein PL188_11090 [Candidatus Cloacimonadota bacterium]|nr:hypothetical protein [Candidatus Cloacimonadota bacterium]